MTSIRAHKVEVTLHVLIEKREFDRHVPTSSTHTARELAKQVVEYEEQNKLGYYPALSYLKEIDAISHPLYAQLEKLSWVLAQYVREVFTQHLQPLYANMKFNRLQCLAFTLSKVRCKQANAIELLEEHYVPNAFIIDLQVSVLQKHDIKDVIARFVSKQMTRNLCPHFEQVEVSSARVIE